MNEILILVILLIISVLAAVIIISFKIKFYLNNNLNRNYKKWTKTNISVVLSKKNLLDLEIIKKMVGFEDNEEYIIGTYGRFFPEFFYNFSQDFFYLTNKRIILLKAYSHLFRKTDYIFYAIHFADINDIEKTYDITSATLKITLNSGEIYQMTLLTRFDSEKKKILDFLKTNSLLK